MSPSRVKKPIKKTIAKKGAFKKSAVKKTTKKATLKNASKATVLALVGQAVPKFSLPATGGRSVSPDQFRGQAIVLYFYPRDATPGCTVEGHDFSRLYEQFKSSGAEVFGISRDTLKSHEKFKDCENYKIDLLSDADETACKLFGVMKLKNMYGKQVRGIERSTFVIDSQGKIVKEWRGVKVPGHAEEVLGFVKSLASI